MKVPGSLGRQVGAVFIGLTVTACVAYGQGVVINEVMALNAQTLADESGQSGDWIELHNPTAQAVDVGGMYLTDDLQNPTSWQIPAGTTVAAGGYLLLWADGTGAGLHAGFKLASDGEALGLFARDGATMIDSVEFPSQRPDISYGRDPGDSGAWRYLIWPTPGKRNAAAYADVVEDLTLSHQRGFYDQAFSLEINTATAGAIIVYTLDGSDPCDPFGGFSATAKTYNSPILISTTTCLRAMACRAGWLPSHVATHTCLFVTDVAKQSQSAALAAGYPSTWSGYPADYEMDAQVTNDSAYRGQMADALLSIPVVSIVTDRDYLFDSSIGIYTNPLSEGDALEWERPVSMELFQADGAKELQIDCGIRIQGGHSRKPEKCAKHSFGLRFRAEYGHTSLDYDLFEDTPIKSFDSLQLRGVFNNAWTHHTGSQCQRAQYVRDHWARNSLTEMGDADALQGFSAHLYLNGIYWGLYMLHERPSATHYAAYNGGDPDAIDAVNGDPTYIISDPLNTGQLSEGTLDAWLELKTIVASRDWEEIQKVLDVDNFIDWTILNYYGGNIDLKQGTNWRAAGGGPERRPWRFYSWDAERILENLNYTSLGVPDATGLFNALSGIEEFRVRFGDRVHKHLFNGGALTAEPSAQRYTKRSDAVELAVIAESARWGDYRRDLPFQYRYGSGPYDLYTKNKYWTPEKNRLLTTYFPARTAIVVNLFRNFKPRALYPSVGAPVFNVNGVYRHGGYVLPTDALSLTVPQGTTGKIYYTVDGSDPRAAGTGGVSTTASQYTLPIRLQRSACVKARVLSGSTWSALNEAVYAVGPVAESLRISEIMYHPEDTGNPDDPNTEFVELTNIGTQTIHLDLVRFTNGVDFAFGDVALAPSGYVLVVKDAGAFSAKHGPGLPVAGTFTGSLDNGGERIRLEDALGEPILDFEYKDGWYKSTDGQGYSLVLRDPATAAPADLSDKTSWRASHNEGGSPGQAD